MTDFGRMGSFSNRTLIYQIHMISRLCIASLLFAIGSFSSQAEIVSSWNEIASDTLVANTSLQNPGMASRTMAMMNLAIYDSLAMTRSDGQTFYDYNGLQRVTSASGTAAAAAAAHAVLVATYPDQQSALDASLAASLSSLPAGPDTQQGVALGASIGQSVVGRRSSDGYDLMIQYQPTNQVGHWQPDPLNPTQQAWGPAWGTVDTFRLPSVTSFMPPPPPALNTQQYADAFNEVKELGELNSTTRTTEQTEIGNFWAYDRLGMGTPIRLYNQALRNIAEQQGNTTEQNAELFAKATVAMADAGIVAWNSKFEFDLWRPVTGIREADSDGNPLTEADPNWVPLRGPELMGQNFTPPFPTYLSGHATFGGALFTSIADFYGTDDISFMLSSDELNGLVRSFDTLSQAMVENGRSRVYLGIHWNYDDTVAQATGRDVANYISTNAFVSITAVPEPSSIVALSCVSLILVGVRRKRVV